MQEYRPSVPRKKTRHSPPSLPVGALLSWYAENKRGLPWRKTSDPYRILVSEVLLQQTRVEQAIPYYFRFLEKFPDLRALADADIGSVLKAWEGAGYYSRARNLHKAANDALARYGGLPKTYASLLSLPGVGPYTAAAVSSIAFGENHAVLDGNVVRVLSRYLALKKDAGQSGTKAKLLAFAQENLPSGKAGDYNQALMELGATVCLPKKPSCARCPLRKNCEAFALGTQESFPVKKKKKPVPHYQIACAVVRKGGKILICQRKQEGFLGGLWEFPGGKAEPGESFAQAAKREVLEETGVHVRVGKKIASVNHAYSHFKITLHAFEAEWVSGIPRPLGCGKVLWVRPSDLEKYAFPKANRIVLDALSLGCE